MFARLELLAVISLCGGCFNFDQLDTLYMNVDASVPPPDLYMPVVCNGAEVACHRKCFDLMTDNNHCGGCDTACNPGQECRAGVCASDWRVVQPMQQSQVAAGWASGVGDVYAVGEYTIHSSDNGASWLPQPSPVGLSLKAIWGSGKGDIYSAGEAGTILRSTGNNDWTNQISTTTSQISMLWGNSAGSIIAVTEGGTVLNSAGTGVWTPVATLAGDTVNLPVIWGSGTNYWIGGETYLWRSIDGGIKFKIELTQAFVAVWGTDVTHVFGVESDGTVVSSNGDGTWPTMKSLPGSYLTMWGTTASDFYIGGLSGEIQHFSNGTFIAEASGTGDSITVIFGGGAADVYAGTENGQIFRRK